MEANHPNAIREATEADIPRIVEMGARSLAEGPYKDIIAGTAAAEKLARDLVASAAAKVLLYERDGETVGLVAFTVLPHFFSGEPTGTEVMWFVLPEHRQSFAAVALLRAAERIARAMGAKQMQFTAPTPEVGRMYELLGYAVIEIGYQRTL